MIDNQKLWCYFATSVVKQGFSPLVTEDEIIRIAEKAGLFADKMMGEFNERCLNGDFDEQK